MKFNDQQKVWNKIASEWFEFRDKPLEDVISFLKKQKSLSEGRPSVASLRHGQTKGKILDLGGGAGRHLLNLKRGKMYLVDFSKEMIKFAKQNAKKGKVNAEFIVSRAEKLPFKNNFFDAAICVALLHCVPSEKNREKVVSELFRVLKPGARAKILVWNKDSKRFKNSPKERTIKWRDKGKRYYYFYNEKEIYDLFKKVGFKLVKKFRPDKNIVFVVQKPG